MSTPFTRTFTAAPGDIDELGHVNNAVWVQWIQQVSVGHWEAVALPEHQAAHVWVVLRHEIDYRGNLTQGESVVATTTVGEPRGARFDRRVTFERAGKRLVEAHTTWALLDKATGRPLRITPAIAAPFLA